MRPVAALAFTAAALCAPLAHASPDLLLDGVTLELSGSRRYRLVSLSNGATITVKPHDGTDGTGFLQIVAHRIQIDAQSSIIASMAGYQGVEGDIGRGAGKGAGAWTSLGPGGGAGYGGKGGFGVSLIPGCQVDPAAAGGSPYSAGADLVSRGSSGSASWKSDAGVVRGGHGGGMIDLQASRIELLGSLLADGGDGYPLTEAAGGGSGGGIRVAAALFMTWGDSAKLSARGGRGGRTSSAEGGAGAGGRIHLLISQTPALTSADVSPGLSECASAAAEPGVLKYFAPLGCPDLDNDGVLSDQCGEPGALDCDDTDPAVRPGLPEKCNGVDDNCDTTIDEGAEADCGGAPCVNGQCVPQDGGTDAAAADGAEEPDATQSDALEADSEGGQGATSEEAGGDGADRGYELRGGCSHAGVTGGGMAWWIVVAGWVHRRRRTRVERAEGKTLSCHRWTAARMRGMGARLRQ